MTQSGFFLCFWDFLADFFFDQFIDDLLFLEHWNNHTVDTSQIIYIA